MKVSISISILVFLCFCSCEKKPEVTAEYPVYNDAYGSEVSFKGKNPDAFLVFDENKRCPYNNSYAFRTYKPYKGASILKGDYCARSGCGYSWDLHDDK